MAASVLPDDMVVEILSRLPLKSFCRFKCVSKSWLAFSSDPHYRQKLPRTPAGILYSGDGTVIHLARLPSSDREIDTTLRGLPCYDEYPLEPMDCSNGLLLCYHGGISSYVAKTSNAIVCNLATQEWMALPNTEPEAAFSDNNLILCFDPLWSQHFYVFRFQSIPNFQGTITEIQVFFSENSTWSSCLWETPRAFVGDSLFVNGVLYVEHLWEHELLALDAPDTHTQRLNHSIVKLPGFPRQYMFHCHHGCLCQSSGVLCYAQHELYGCMLRIWSLEGPDMWVVKHRLSVMVVFGRDIVLHCNHEGYWFFDYDILAFDLEREVVILVDKIEDTIISYNISTRKGSVIQKIPKISELHRCLFYVPYYGKVPALVHQGVQEEC